MRIVSYVIIGIMVMVFITPLNNMNTSIEPLNYLLRTAYHANTTHLLANMLSFYGLSFIEDAIGSAHFLISILFIWIVSSILLYVYQTWFPSRKIYTIGFSGVVYGLFVVYISLLGDQSSISTLGLIASLIPQFFVSGVSIEGHIMGIISGFIYVMLFKPKHFVSD